MSTKTTFRGALSRYAERSVTANSIYAARQDETRRRVLSAEEREIQRDIACWIVINIFTKDARRHQTTLNTGLLLETNAQLGTR